MKKTKIVSSWSKHNLPSELCTEILSCLPVKSLLRFRCVSKSWQSLIDDPNFCRLHLNNFKNNNLETHLFVSRFNRVTIYYSTTYTKCTVFDPPDTSKGWTKNLSNSTIFGNRWDVVCSLDGLVLLRFNPIFGFGLELALWNPSIRRARVLHSCHSNDEVEKYFDLGFGFDPIIKDYKLIRFVKCGERYLRSIQLYTVGSGMWRTIRYQHAGGSSWPWDFFYSHKWKRLCCRGNLYFTASRVKYGPRELVSFDLSSEVFASISFPIDDGILIDKGFLVLLDGGCSLGLAHISRTNGSIWVLESLGDDIDAVYWSKRYTFSSRIYPSLYPLYYFIYIKKNGEMLVHLHPHVISYNLQTHEEKTLGYDCDVGMAHAYLESLLLLNG